MLHNLYFPQNAVYFIILSFAVQIIFKIFINPALKFKLLTRSFKVKMTYW